MLNFICPKVFFFLIIFILGIRKKDLDLALSKSTAKWKIVIGHHTIKSAGHHGIIMELAQQLVPILEVITYNLGIIYILNSKLGFKF